MHKYISDEDEQLWVWEYTTDDGGHDLFMDINEEIRFRVVDEVFTDLSPAGPEMSGEKKSTDDTENKRSPYSITVSHFAIIKGIEVSIVSKSPNEGQTAFHVPWGGGGTPYMIYSGAPATRRAAKRSPISLWESKGNP